MPSMSHEFSSRFTICSSSGVEVDTRSPITVLITSLSVITPTTRLYSLTMIAKSSRACGNCSSTSVSESRSGITSALCSVRPWSKASGWPLSTRWNMSLAST
ncbi:hypothetical protein D9M69_578610 [compost metagenome]